MNSLSLVNERSLLTRFTVGEEAPRGDRLANALTGGALVLTLILGGLLMTAEIATMRHAATAQQTRVQVRLEPAVEPDIPAPAPAEIPVLEPQTILSAPVEREVVSHPEPAAAVASETPAIPEETPAAPARRVYGVRKVYAKGLGSGGQGASDLVTKRGNTLDGVRDTLTATTADLQGELAPLSSIDRAPEPVHRIKPVYSAAMRKAQARGVVSAYLLIDADGTVKDVKITADIGWDSAQVATAALERFRFRPAQKDGQPVAVWIRHRIRFEIQE